jgi:HTH-type transcriptional regulator/antitoxin HigA
METLKYKIIKNKTQYKEYCNVLEELVMNSSKDKSIKEEIELLTFLIEKWDKEHNSFDDLDPIQLLHYLMDENGLKAKDLVSILKVSKGLVSDILNYKKGLSKEIIRILSTHFKVSQEVLNRPYKLKSEYNSHLRNASVMNTQKELIIPRQKAS